MKVKKWILVGCLLVCFSFVLVSCKGTPEDTENSSDISEETEKTPEVDNPYATAQNLEENGCFYLGDYESLEQCMELTISGGMRLSQNEDKQFVKHGEQSLKIELEGMNPGWSEPESVATLSFESGDYFQKTDFSDCSKLIFEIYSAQEEDVMVWVDIESQWACGYAFMVHHGWNTLEIEKWKLNYSYRSDSTEADVDPEQTFANEINSITLKFPAYSTFQGDSQLYYLDAVRGQLE